MASASRTVRALREGVDSSVLVAEVLSAMTGRRAVTMPCARFSDWTLPFLL